MFDILLLALQLAPGPAATNQGTPPKLLNEKALLTPNDYPNEALRRNAYGVLTAVLRVSASGKVSSCSVTETSGSKPLDDGTCKLLTAKAMFEPARDSAGLATDGEYYIPISWGIDEHQPTVVLNLPLQVATLPRDYRSPIRAKLTFDATGQLAGCDITESCGSESADRAVCVYAKRQFVINAPRSSSSGVAAVAARYLVASLTEGSPRRQ